MFRRLKHFVRRRRLARLGLMPQLSVPTFTAGERSGVWTVCSDDLGPASVVYSFGVGDNIAWDLAMIDVFDATVHAFDPTLASADWVRQQRLPERFHFHPVGVAARDGTARFHLPARGSRFNYQPIDDAKPDWREAAIEAPVCRLTTLRDQLGHDRLDVLKMDVEGGEYEVLDDLLAGDFRPRQLLVEFHHHFAGVGLERTARAVKGLFAAGYALFHVSDRGLEFSFLHTG